MNIEAATARANRFASQTGATMAMREIARMLGDLPAEGDSTEECKLIANWCDLLESRAERHDHAAQYRVIAKRLRSHNA